MYQTLLKILLFRMPGQTEGGDRMSIAIKKDQTEVDSVNHAYYLYLGRIKSSEKALGVGLFLTSSNLHLRTIYLNTSQCQQQPYIQL